MDVKGLCSEVRSNVQAVIGRIEHIEKSKYSVDPDNLEHLSRRKPRLSEYSDRLANLLDKWHDFSIHDFQAPPNCE